MIACKKKKEIPTAPEIDVRRVRRDTSLNPAMVGRILIPARTSPPVEDHWRRFTPPTRSDKGGSRRLQSRFYRQLARGLNPPSSLSRRCLVYLQWRRRDTHPRTHTTGTVEKAALCGGWGWRKGWRMGGRGGWFSLSAKSAGLLSKKRRSSRWWHVRNRHVRCAFGADSGRVDEEVDGERKHRGRSSSSCPECDATAASRAPRSSGKIVALNSHAAAPAVRHETRMTYGICPCRRTGEG